MQARNSRRSCSASGGETIAMYGAAKVSSGGMANGGVMGG
jgi:hypothetical protein